MSLTSLAGGWTDTAGADVVELEVPAGAAYIAVVRTAAAGLAARVDLTLDRIEDLRIAVDEACALLVGPGSDRTPGRTLRCLFVITEVSLVVEVRGPHTDLPDRSAFAWAVLSALVDGIETGEDDTGRTWLRLVVRRGTGQWS
jgi:serine/threonine-protein kinase RsbW